MSQHIGYKKIQNDFIVKLRIKGQNNEGRSDIKPENVPFAKYRCERAFVLDIYHSLDKTKHIDKGYGLYDPKFSYGQLLLQKKFKNNKTECKEKWWYQTGELWRIYYYKYGNLLTSQTFNKDGKLVEEIEYGKEIKTINRKRKL